MGQRAVLEEIFWRCKWKDAIPGPEMVGGGQLGGLVVVVAGWEERAKGSDLLWA